MSPQQEQAVRSLQRALNRCAKAGLSGGVYESKFYVWPTGSHPSDGDAGKGRTDGEDFFSAVEGLGGALVDSTMRLDGGAGN